MSEKFNALKLDLKDNVAIALENLKKGSMISFLGGNKKIEVIKNIPYGHKIAIIEINKESKVIKYGETMGIATKDIAVGDHVHVSNVRGLEMKDKDQLIQYLKRGDRT